MIRKHSHGAAVPQPRAIPAASPESTEAEALRASDRDHYISGRKRLSPEALDPPSIYPELTGSTALYHLGLAVRQFEAEG
ncbi:MAG: hypothetical protein JWM80_5477 [Cyanobacteria bacterium RYN_339]|nr:hypothetical protein [Cyanobacteria bacterium RYN_339]